MKIKKKILIIIGGGISAYKSLDLIRLLKKDGYEIKTVLTKSGKQFVTPLSLSTVSENPVLSKFKDDAVFNKRKYGIHNFGEETNNNNTREMLWKVLPFSEVEILDEYIEDGFITENNAFYLYL
mgnify:CR=1 FL=1